MTAGLILLIKFVYLLKMRFFLKFIFFFGFLTIRFSSVIGLLEVDIKKIIALRTLSQIGFLIILLGLGLRFLTFLHLISHALFKSLLFIQIGFFIHNSFGGQDYRFYKNLKNLRNFIKFNIMLTLLCLCGLFFTRGIVRKDLILEILLTQRFYFFFIFFVLLGIYITYFYSLRLIKGLFQQFNLSLFFVENTRMYNYFCLGLFFFSIFLIWNLIKNFFFIPLCCTNIDIFVPLVYLFMFFFFFSLFFFFLIIIFKSRFIRDFLPKFFINRNKVNNFIYVELFFYFLNLQFFFKGLWTRVIGLNYLKLNNFSLIYFIFIFLIFFF